MWRPLPLRVRAVAAKISIETRIRPVRHHSADGPCETIGHSRDADGPRIALDVPLLDRTRDPHSLPPPAQVAWRRGFFLGTPLISDEIPPPAKETRRQLLHTRLCSVETGRDDLDLAD